MNKVVITLILMCVLCAAETVAQGSRIMLTQLERGQVQPADDSLRSGQIGLTNTNGDQRYAPYVEIQVDSVNFIPTPTGNTTNLSEFVYDTTGTLWYIDWQGRAVEFAAGSSSCDVDWLQISDNSCPDAITDSIYKQRYASVGARLVWPGAEFLVNDSLTSGILVVQGSRNARTAWYDSNAGTFSMFDHGGSTPGFYMPVGANMVFKTTAGTPQTPIGSQVDHFAINTQDSTIQMFQYDNTRVDTQGVLNFLYTDPIGKIRSRPITYIEDSLGLGANIYNSNGQTPDNDTRSVIVGGNGASDNGFLTFDYSNSVQTAIAITGGDGAGNTGNVRINSPTQVPAILVENDDASIGDITNTVDGGGFKYAPGLIRIGDPFDIDISGLTINLPLNTTKISESVDNYLQVSSDGTGITGGWADGSGIDIKSASLGTYITQNDLSVNIRGTDNQGSDCLYDILADTTGDIRLLTRRNAGDEQATLTLSTGATGIVSATLQAHNVNAAVVDNFVKVDTGGVEINTKGSPGTAGQVLTSDGLRAYWATGGGGGSGTVTSVGLSLPSIFSVSGSPVTTSGTLTGALATQTANTVFAGPTSGGAAAPTFRALANADLPVGVGGAWIDGGNSFGATGVFGTNDANPITFEINNISRGTLSTTGVFNVTDVTATTNAIVEKVQAGVNSSGTVSTGFGTGYGFYAESSTTNDRLQGRINTRWATVTDASRASEMDFTVVSSGSEVVAMTIEASGDIGIGSTNPLVRLCNGPQPGDGDLVTGAGFGWTVNTAGNTYVAGITNSGTAATSHGLMVETNATDNGSRALTVSVGSTPTRVFTVNADQTVGILDATPESPLDVTGLTKTQHLSGQDLTPTIAVNTAGAGTGATATMTNAQSSDLAGRFSITSGTGATTGLWATITFDDAFTVAPVVQFDCEDADCATLRWYSNTSTTSTELFIASGGADGTVYEFNFIIIGGK